MAPNYRVAPKPTAPIISPSGGPAFLRSPLLETAKLEETHLCDDAADAVMISCSACTERASLSRG